MKLLIFAIALCSVNCILETYLPRHLCNCRKLNAEEIQDHIHKNIEPVLIPTLSQKETNEFRKVN